MPHCLARAILITIASVAAVSARAESASTSLTARIELENACTVAARDLDFGIRSSLSQPVDAATTVEVACTNIGAFSLQFDRGTWPSARAESRKLSNGIDTVNYSLYADPGRTAVLGDATDGTTELTGTGSGSAQTFTVFGRVFAGQGAKSIGVYTDTVTATLGY